jgi:hypothetical protein
MYRLQKCCFWVLCIDRLGIWRGDYDDPTVDGDLDTGDAFASRPHRAEHVGQIPLSDDRRRPRHRFLSG